MNELVKLRLHIQAVLNGSQFLHYVHSYNSEKHEFLIYFANARDRGCARNILLSFPEVLSTEIGMDSDGDLWLSLIIDTNPNKVKFVTFTY